MENEYLDYHPNIHTITSRVRVARLGNKTVNHFEMENGQSSFLRKHEYPNSAMDGVSFA